MRRRRRALRKRSRKRCRRSCRKGWRRRCRRAADRGAVRTAVPLLRGSLVRLPPGPDRRAGRTVRSALICRPSTSRCRGRPNRWTRGRPTSRNRCWPPRCPTRLCCPGGRQSPNGTGSGLCYRSTRAGWCCVRGEALRWRHRFRRSWPGPCRYRTRPRSRRTGRMGCRRPPRVRAAAEQACPARSQGGPGGTGVAGPLRRVRCLAAVRDGHDRTALPAAQSRPRVRVRLPRSHCAVSVVSIDHRPGHRAQVADVDLGRHRGCALQAAERSLPAFRQRLAEIQGARDHGGDRRRCHRPPDRSPQSAARQVRRRTPAVHRPHHHPPPRRPAQRSPASLLRRSPVTHGRAGRSPPGGAAARH
jgi:hypothetical protein